MTDKEESLNIKFEIKDKKLFDVLKSIAYHGGDDSYDAISGYQWIQSHFQSKQQERLRKICEKNKDDMTGLYDYDGIASDVLSILEEE